MLHYVFYGSLKCAGRQEAVANILFHLDVEAVIFTETNLNQEKVVAKKEAVTLYTFTRMSTAPSVRP